MLLYERSNSVKEEFVWSAFEINLTPISPMLFDERSKSVKEFDWSAF